jgi:G3E family GTPase
VAPAHHDGHLPAQLSLPDLPGHSGSFLTFVLNRAVPACLFVDHRYGEEVEKEDDRSISELLVDQIEFADVILVNKVDLVNAAQRRRITSLISNLNPDAKVVHTTNCAVDVRKVINTGMFSLEKVRGSCCLRTAYMMVPQVQQIAAA